MHMGKEIMRKREELRPKIQGVVEVSCLPRVTFA